MFSHEPRPTGLAGRDGGAVNWHNPEITYGQVGNWRSYVFAADDTEG
jgi:hypothetical protein